MLKKLVRIFIVFGYKLCGKLMHFLVTLVFKIVANKLGSGCRLSYPLYFKGSEYIKIGMNFRAEPGLRIEAWDNYLGVKYDPQIIIGNNVAVGFNVHIGSIKRIEIGDNVLIGSNVLITDHQHGRSILEEANILVINRPLYSKGGVIIEDNVWIGDGVCIMDGVRIGRDSVIGANAVVSKNISQGSVAAGIPARILRTIYQTFE